MGKLGNRVVAAFITVTVTILWYYCGDSKKVMVIPCDEETHGNYSQSNYIKVRPKAS